MIKENDTHYFFEGVLHLNAENASMRLTRRETQAERGTRQCSICVSVPKTLFDEPQLSATIEIADAGPRQADAVIIHDVENALSDLPVVVTVNRPDQ